MTEQEHMRRRINAMGFAVYEMELFLDSHPDNQRALAARKEYIMQRDKMIAEYEQKYGPYIINTGDVPLDAKRWIWVDNPWPWDYQADT